MTVFDEIKDRLPIDQYVSRYVPLKKSGNHFKACCPFHQENTPSFFVDPVKQVYFCHGSCHEGGDIFSFAMKYHGWTLLEARDKLADEVGIAVPSRTRDIHLDRYFATMSVIAEALHKLLVEAPSAATARAYLDKRGVDETQRYEFELGFWPPHSLSLLVKLRDLDKDVVNALGLKSERGYELMSNRLVFPIRDARGRVCAFAGRALKSDAEVKYLNTAESPIFRKSNTLYNLDRASAPARKAGQMLLVEGYMDVVTCAQYGYANTVGQMGSALTEDQLKRLKPMGRVLIATDGDKAGLNAAIRAAELCIEQGVDASVALMPDGDDPDSLLRRAPERFSKHVAQALLAEEFLISVIKNRTAPDASVQEREKAALHFVEVVRKSHNPIQQHWHIQKLAAGLGLAAQPLLALLKPAQPAPQRADTPGQTPPDAQTLLIFALANAPARAYDLTRILDAHDLDRLDAADFTSSAYRDIFRLIQESIDQDEEEFDSYVKTRSLIVIPETPDVELTDLVACAKAVLLEGIDERIGRDERDIQSLLRQKAKLLLL